MRETNAQARFQVLDNQRTTLLSRCEDYAKLTLPYLFPDDLYDENSDSLQHSFHSVGAQAVNHLANKIMLALFQPSSPFFRLSLPDSANAELKRAGVEDGMIEEALANGERAAMARMAQGNFRPVQFETIKQLIVVGNALPIFEEDGEVTLLTLRDYVVQRTRRGEVVEIVTREVYKYENLDDDAREAFEKAGGSAQEDEEVTLYHWITRRKGKKDFVVSQWVNEVRLPEAFDSKYKSYDRLPWQPQVWVLPSKSHYGVGLVEEYYGDLSSIDLYAESQTDGATLASLWRFLANPAGNARPEDITRSENGDAIPGTSKDIELLTANVGSNLSTVSAMMQDTIQRVGRGFLMLTAVQRDAERVTAQEIRALANELETGLGGVYTRLAVSLQQPMASFLLDQADVEIQGTALEVTVVTGFEALSRQSELEKMSLFIQDVANISQLPPEIRDWLKEEQIYNFLAAGRGLERAKYLRTAAQVEERQSQRSQAQQQQALALEQAKRQPQPNQGE